jgi:KipI family sensor histidine kinase inhibitor
MIQAQRLAEDALWVATNGIVDPYDLAAVLRSEFPETVVWSGKSAVLITNNPAGFELPLGLDVLCQRVRQARISNNHLVDVVYDGQDLALIADAACCSIDEVVRRHSAIQYEVTLNGFLPGFAYLETVDPVIQVARLPVPRLRVPAGSVGIAGPMTGIYPFASSGGWNLIGSADATSLFDADRTPAALFARGDRVRFRPVDHPRLQAARSHHDEASVTNFSARVLRTPAAASIQDLGRPAARVAGVPASGALDPLALLNANEALGNPRTAAGIEIPLGSFELIANEYLDVCADGERPRSLAPGESVTVTGQGRAVRYLALRGGVDVPLVLGSRSTLAVASLGGHHGRFLRRFDSIRRGGPSLPEDRRETLAEEDEHESLRIFRGPDLGGPELDDDAFIALVNTAFRIASFDRLGTRLEGPKLPRKRSDRTRSPEPTLRGMVQVTNDGTPIVLGPDAAVTGGYPVVALLSRAAQFALARRLPGAPVRFRAT